MKVIFCSLFLPAFLFLSAISGFSQESAKRFDFLDKDSDGFLSKRELARLPNGGSWLARADTDGDGKVSRDEIESVFRDIAESRPDPDAAPLVLKSEAAGDSRLSLHGMAEAAEYSAGQNGYSFLVMVDGRVLYERYDQGWKPERAHRLASGTKSFSAAILAAAVKDGIAKVDEPVASTINEWQGKKGLSKVTLRQLLSLTSGIDSGTVGKVPDYDEAFETAALHKPGSHFSYGPVPFQIFGEVMRRKLVGAGDTFPNDPAEYLKVRVLSKIGMDVAEWRRGSDGMPKLPSGLVLTAREWAKYGNWLLMDGLVDGEGTADVATLKEARSGTDAKPGYGLTFWLLDAEGELGRVDPALQGTYMAAGAGKQRLYVMPELNAVVVRQGESRKLEDKVLLKRLLAKK